MVRYKMNISISVFGDYGYPIDSMISEFRNFVSNNSLIDLNINVGKYAQLQDSEFGQPDPTWGYVVYPWNLLPSTKQKIPSNVQINILMYDWKNKPTGYGGGTLGGDYGVYPNVPFIIIPLGQYPNFETNPWGPWSTVIAQRLTHEWMHAFKWILDVLYNLTGFPNADGVCEQYGYNDQNDPGWAICYQFFLSTKITTAMYQAIENNNYKPTPTVTPTTTPSPTVKTNFWIAIDKGKTEIRRKSDNALLVTVDSNYIKTLQLTIGTEYKLQSFPDSGYAFDKYCKYKNNILLECITANPTYFIPESGITEYNFKIYFKSTVTTTPTTTPTVTPTITPTTIPTTTPTVTPTTPTPLIEPTILLYVAGAVILIGSIAYYIINRKSKP